MKWNCPYCNEEKSYNARYDAYYCRHCDKWLEEDCKDPACYCNCKDRPNKPSEYKKPAAAK